MRIHSLPTVLSALILQTTALSGLAMGKLPSPVSKLCLLVCCKHSSDKLIDPALLSLSQSMPIDIAWLHDSATGSVIAANCNPKQEGEGPGERAGEARRGRHFS